MEAHYIIRKPILTEKSTWESSENNRFTFSVDRTATKTEIKAAVQELYNVRVVAVNTVTQRSASRRLKYGTVGPKITKKAIVRIHPDDTLELF